MSTKTRTIFTLYSVVGMIALFCLPYYFPQKELVSISTSYDYGFNNRAGVIILLLLCLGLVLYGLTQTKNADITKYNELILSHDNSLHKIFVVCMALQVMFCLFIWFCVRDTYGIIESKYFLLRLHDLIAGRKLYVDIEFAYGALMLYIPMMLYKIFSAFSLIKIQDAYFFSLFIMQCLSFYLLYKIISRLKIEATAKKIIFIALFIVTLPFHTGMNYILFRFVPAYAALFYLDNLRDKNSPPPP